MTLAALLVGADLAQTPGMGPETAADCPH